MGLVFNKYQRDNGSTFISIGVKVIIDGIQYGITEHIDSEVFYSMVENLKTSENAVVLHLTKEELDHGH